MKDVIPAERLVRRQAASGGAEAGKLGAQPPVRGQWLLDRLDAAFARLDRAVRAVVPENLDPLAQPGAVANVLLLVAIVSGVLLLFWYVPSVQSAHSSLEAITGLTLGQVMRSLHRYSSDACMLFVLLHALRALAGRQMAGPRRLAWITGACLLLLLWVVGWLGYWLVWDERAQQVALGSARAFDALPIVSDPITRNFLVDEAVSSQLFFVIFFIHMLLPMGMGIALWLHITRLSRPRFLTNRRLAGWIVGSLVVLSVVAPATSAGAAHMTQTAQAFTMDWWYLLPLALTDRLSGGAIWAVFLLGGLVAVGLPWLLVRRGRAGRPRAVPAKVAVESCNDCRRCVADCPYAAITMVPRTDGRGFEAQAYVDPDRCVGCGICVGSCDSSAIQLPWLPSLVERQRLDGWLKEDEGKAPFVAYVCAESAAAGLQYDPATGHAPELPGYRVIGVPCAGAVHALTVERALRRGAGGVLVVSCPSGACGYREGPKWTGLRLAGQREPALRVDKIDPQRVRIVELDRSDRRRLPAAARAFRGGLAGPAAATGGRPARIGGALALVVALAALIWAPSDLPYRTGAGPEPELVVSFKHPGSAQERCRELTAEELEAKPVHMRQPTVCDRDRAAVRMTVEVEGETVLERSYEPAGLFNDGSSIALERVPLEPGVHRIRVTIDDGAARFSEETAAELRAGEKRVLLFDKSRGFTWH